jgi:hypothetical protein
MKKDMKWYWVVIGYFAVLILFFSTLSYFVELLTNREQSEGLFFLFIRMSKEIVFYGYAVFGFAIATLFVSITLYLYFRKKGKTELMKGFKITSILSLILLFIFIFG